MIPYGRQEIVEDDIEAVIETLKSDFLTQGPKVAEFENDFCSYTNAKYGVSVNSATSALHVACLALGISERSLVWTSTISFVASANCALYTGAKIDFIDIDPETLNICPVELEIKLSKAKIEGRLPTAIIVVHMCGQPCEMLQIKKLSDEYGFKIIEDASHAVGAKYLGEPVGNCKYSDITVFSFHPVKIMTTGEGGMATTNSSELASKMSLFRSHGITRDEKCMTRESEGPWYYQQLQLGFNYRMTDFQAALGISQLRRVDLNVNRRNYLANRYKDNLRNVKIQKVLPDGYSSYHLFVIQIEKSEKRLQFFNHLRAKGINVNVHYIPIHLQPFYSNLGFKKGDFPNAENYYERCITLPLFPTLSEEKIDFIISEVNNFR